MATLGRKLIRALKSANKTVYSRETGKIDWTYALFEVKHALLDKLVYSWLTPITVFQESCIRTWKWLPIIWKDRHWDHWHILEILRHKIRFQREHITECDRHTTAQADGKQMRVAEILLNRIQDDDYGVFLMEEHEKKWGDYVRGSNKDNIYFDNKFSNSGMRRAKITSQAEWEQERKEHLAISKHCDYMKKQDYDYLFKHLKRHIERWWD